MNRATFEDCIFVKDCIFYSVLNFEKVYTRRNTYFMTEKTCSNTSQSTPYYHRRFINSVFFIVKPHYIYRYTLSYIQTINTPFKQLYTTIERHINHTLPFFIITQPADTKHWASVASALGVAAQMLVQCRDKSVFSAVKVFSAVFC